MSCAWQQRMLLTAEARQAKPAQSKRVKAPAATTHQTSLVDISPSVHRRNKSRNGNKSRNARGLWSSSLLTSTSQRRHAEHHRHYNLKEDSVSATYSLKCFLFFAREDSVSNDVFTQISHHRTHAMCPYPLKSLHSRTQDLQRDLRFQCCNMVYYTVHVASALVRAYVTYACCTRLFSEICYRAMEGPVLFLASGRRSIDRPTQIHSDWGRQIVGPTQAAILLARVLIYSLCFEASLS